jgi:hypothetical protein
VGSYQSYGHPKYGLIITKWPRKRGPATTPAAIDNQDTFAQVVAWAKNPMAGEVEAAQIGTKASGYLIRDVIESACYGMVVTAYCKDGTVIRGRRMANADIQALLDTISSTVGSILVRGSSGWTGLDAGDITYVLTSFGAGVAPGWAPASGGGGGGGALYCVGAPTNVSTGQGTGDIRYFPILCTKTGTVSEISIGLSSAMTGDLLIGIYSDTGTGEPNTLVAQTAELSGLESGITFVPLAVPLDVTAANTYWAGIISSATLPTFGPVVGNEYYTARSYSAGLPATVGGLSSYGGSIASPVGMLIA